MSIHNVWKNMKIEKELEKRDRLEAELNTKLNKISKKKVDPLASLQSSFEDNSQGEDGARNPFDEEEFMVQKSRKRAIEWASNNLMNQNLLDAMNKGIDSKVTFHNHKFRDRSKHREMSSIPFISKNYKPAKKRALEAEADYQKSYIYKGPYNDRELKKGVERERAKNKEIGPDFRYGIRTENERIYNTLVKNGGTDYAIKDMKMVHYPDWKPDQKENWVDRKNFTIYNPKLSLASGKSAWKQTKNRIPGKNDPYIEGLEKLGNDLSLRTRNPSKEVKKNLIRLWTGIGL